MVLGDGYIFLVCLNYLHDNMILLNSIETNFISRAWQDMGFDGKGHQAG